MPTDTPNATPMLVAVTTVDQPGRPRDHLRQRKRRTAIPISPPSNRDQHGFRQELTDDVGLPCTDGAANSDFPGAFEHRGEHDVHDADTADQQRNAGDADHDYLEGELGAALLLQQAGGHDDVEIAGVLMGAGQDRLDDAGRFDRIDVRVQP